MERNARLGRDLSQTVIARKCGLERCVSCRSYFVLERRGAVVCPSCEVSRPCFVCGRQHTAPGLSCWEAKNLAEKNEPR